VHSDVLILKLWILCTVCCKVVRPILSVFLRQAAVHVGLKLRPVQCNLHYGPTPQLFHKYDTFENRSFEQLLKPVIVYLQCMLRDSHCYFLSCA